VDIRFSALYTPDMPLTVPDFVADRHASAYVPALEAHPMATNRLLGLLNDPENEQRLIHAAELEQPALLGVSRFLEADSEIVTVLELGSAGYRFRQAVGVAIRLKMEAFGWSTTGRKAAVSGARYFTKAECYSR
jgi:hypothetical protein